MDVAILTPKRFAAGGSYRDSEVVITSGFRIRHLDSDENGREPTNENGAVPGTAATSAVVKAAFLVIVADLIATAMFYLMGWSAAG